MRKVIFSFKDEKLEGYLLEFIVVGDSIRALIELENGKIITPSTQFIRFKQPTAEKRD